MKCVTSCAGKFRGVYSKCEAVVSWLPVILEGAKDEIPQSSLGLPCAAVGHHVPGPRVYFGRRPAHAGSAPYRPSGLGLGDRRLHAGLRGIRDPERRAGRSHRTAPRAFSDRIVVVGLHIADGAGRWLLSAAAGPVSFRHGGGGRISLRGGGGGALVSGARARAGVWNFADGQPGGRRDCPVAGSADPDSVRVAGIFLCIRRGGSRLERGLVLVVPRFAGGEGGRQPGRAGGDSAA